MASKQRRRRIEAFSLEEGFRLADKYVVIARIGGGYEGEVYLTRERGTGIERAAKLFFPHRNPRNRTAANYARTLHRLRDCSMVIHYHTQEIISWEGQPVTVLVSEYVHGELLHDFLARQPGRRLNPFQGLHLLYALAQGLEEIHSRGDYHGDLHEENIFVSRWGLGFELKLVDLYRWSGPKGESVRDDIDSAVKVFYDAVGGLRRYKRQPPEVKAICCGLKKGLLQRRFPTARALVRHLERLEWS